MLRGAQCQGGFVFSYVGILPYWKTCPTIRAYNDNMRRGAILNDTGADN